MEPPFLFSDEVLSLFAETGLADAEPALQEALVVNTVAG